MFKSTTKLFLTVLFLVFFTVGCNETNMPKKEITNKYANKNLLILSKASEFKLTLIDILIRRLQRSYSLTIDDPAKIYDYNFGDFTNVVIIDEPVAESYLKNYGGINNIIVVIINGNKDYQPDIPAEFIVIDPDKDLLSTEANRLVQRIKE